MLWVLASGALDAFRTFGFRFLSSTAWNPVPGREHYGAWPYIFGTVVCSLIAIVIAVPIAVGVALLLNQMKAGWLRDPLAVFVDLLAAIPSIVYGLWGLFVLVPLFNKYVDPFLHDTVGRVPIVGTLFQPPSYANPAPPHNTVFSYFGGNMLIAGVLLAIMILPIVTAVSREVIAIVPPDLREAAKALGATEYETIRMSVLPYARSGIVGATMLGLGRAIGETIAVAMVIGASPTVGSSLVKARYTIPAKIANTFNESAGLGRSALLAMALILVVIALIVAAISRLYLRRTRRIMGDLA
jgi:phosphate transport system permease protein